MRLGLGEIIVIGFVLVVVFSASRMGALGNAVGKFVFNYRKASRGEGYVDVTPSSRKSVPPPEDAQILPNDERR